MSAPAHLFCPACRAPGHAAPIDDTLRCTAPSCGETYRYLDGTDVPVIFTEPQLASVMAYDVLGPLEPYVTLGSRIAELDRDGHAWDVVHRAASYVWSHARLAGLDGSALPERLLEFFASAFARSDLDPPPGSAPPAPLRALDLACGVGSFAMALAARAHADVIALDSNPHALRWALLADHAGSFPAPWRLTASRFEMREVPAPPSPRAPHRVTWVCGNALDPPFAGESFDLVCLVNALDSFSDPALGLAQASALLRPGGHLLLAQPDAWMSHVTHPDRWIAETADGWDAALGAVGLRTLRATDGIEWTVRSTDSVRYGYTLHARIAVREAWPT